MHERSKVKSYNIGVVICKNFWSVWPKTNNISNIFLYLNVDVSWVLEGVVIPLDATKAFKIMVSLWEEEFIKQRYVQRDVTTKLVHPTYCRIYPWLSQFYSTGKNDQWHLLRFDRGKPIWIQWQTWHYLLKDIYCIDTYVKDRPNEKLAFSLG